MQYVEMHPELTESKYTTLYKVASDPKRHICVSRMLEVLGVSKKGYYDLLTRTPSNRSLQKTKVKDAIKNIYDRSG